MHSDQNNRNGTITAFPEDIKLYILLSYLSSEKHIYAKFFEQINNAPLEKIIFYFSLILPLNSENMVISPDLWNKWDDETQQMVKLHLITVKEEK